MPNKSVLGGKSLGVERGVNKKGGRPILPFERKIEGLNQRSLQGRKRTERKAPKLI